MKEIIIDGNNISRVGDSVLEFMLKTVMYITLLIIIYHS